LLRRTRGVARSGSHDRAGVAAGGGGRLSGTDATAFVDGLHHAVIVSGGCLLVAPCSPAH